jgi:cytochrome b561
VTSRMARASLESNPKAHRMPEVQWSLGAAAVAAGLTDIHAAFGTLLCALVAWQFLQHARDPAQSSHAEVRQFARRVSRMVYLMLYLVLSLKLLAGVTSLSWHDGGVALTWSVRFVAAPERTFMECGERFRGDLLCGVIALCLNRALSAHRTAVAPPVSDAT